MSEDGTSFVTAEDLDFQLNVYTQESKTLWWKVADESGNESAVCPTTYSIERASEKNDERGNDGLSEDNEKIVGRNVLSQRRLDEQSHQNAVDDERNVIAHQHGADKALGVAVEELKDACRPAAFLLVELQAHAVGRDKGHLHAAEESGEDQGDEYADE